jgi:8-oxo-dGTP pyrophosphatase MutT (NUDIX family)
MSSYCNNCGRNGHSFHQCKSPIISYGIIAFRKNLTKNNTREYLLIRRKDTLGFVDFMRGKYSIYNKEYILNMIKQMTNDEKLRLINDPFSKLWGDLWGIQYGIGETSSNIKTTDPYKAEEQSSRNKFESLKSGIYTKTECYTLEELIKMTEESWTDAEWGFPKGRRNYQERDYDCAVREFCEETGYSLDKLILLKNVQPFEEIFTGSNYKSYKHKYYVTYMNYSDTLTTRHLQACEVSESAWMSFDQCYAVIRSYNVEKKRLLTAVEQMLSNNFLSKPIC